MRAPIAWCAAALALVAGCTSTGGGTPASPASPAPTSVTSAPTAPGSVTTSASVPSRTPAPTESFTMAFAGDVHFMNQVGERLSADPATTFGPAAAVLRKADLTMVNLETAIATGGDPQAKSFTFRAPPSAFTALRDAGVDVATMANNHGADYGASGLEETLAAIEKYHFPVVGIGRNAAAAFAPYRTTLAGTKIAIIAADQVQDETTLRLFSAGPDKPGVANAFDERLLESVRAARAAGRVVIVYLHWGIEYQTCPSGDQERLAGELADAGAAAVIGTHAHVLQGAGWLPNGTYVAYGLGNYLWWRTFGNAQDDNGVLTLAFRHGKVTGSAFAPAHLQSSGVPVPATGADRTRILDEWERLRDCTDLAASPSH